MFVELGTHGGVSYTAFCEAIVRGRLETRCFAIDTWRGDEHAGFYGEEIYQQFSSFHDERYGRFSVLLRSTFDEAVDKFNDFSIDLLHIDGLHTYEAVRHDFEIWQPKLSERAVVLLHDTSERQGDFGVWRVWDELQEQFPSFEFLHGHGLGVLAVGQDPPPVVVSLCSLSDAAAVTTIRERFAFAGERWAGEMHERWMNEVHQLNARNELGIRDVRLREVEQTLDSALREAAETESRANAQIQAAHWEAAEERKAAQAEALARIEIKSRLEAVKAQAREDVDKLRREVAALGAQIAAAHYETSELQRRAEREELSRKTAEAAKYRELDAKYKKALSELQGWPTAMRAAARRLPAPARNVARKAAKIVLWTVTRRLKEKLRERRESVQSLDLVAKSRLFDSNWYRHRYPDVSAAGIDSAFHYVRHGAAEGRNPGPAFDANLYLETYPDVAATGVNPLLHYLRFGEAEGREIQPVNSDDRAKSDDAVELIRTSSLFDADWYRERYPEVATAAIEPVLHYLELGAAEGKNPGPRFDGNWYLEANPDVAAAGLNPLFHYLQFGATEGREIRALSLAEAGYPKERELLEQMQVIADSSLFDVDWYRKRYPDVLESGMNPLVHYIRFGAAEGRNPGPYFDGNFYLQRYPDVAEAGLNPLIHYAKWGAAEGREIRPVTEESTGITAYGRF